ncbi:MAG: hypothetical protein AAF927_10150 [Bacteroidota bacterium]
MKSLLVLPIFLLTPLFSQPLAADGMSYLSIMVEHNRFNQNIYISESGKDIRVIEVWQNPREQLIRNNKSNGIETIGVSNYWRYDNSTVFALIAEYEAEGWQLHSQNFSTGEARAQTTSFTSRMSYFLFTKE